MTYATKIYKEGGGDTMQVVTGGSIVFSDDGALVNDNVVRNIRTRFTVAGVNAGATILAALPGYKYRMVDCTIASQGGAAATGTAVVIQGTQTSAVSLVSFAQAQLTDDCYLKPGITGATILANGVSFLANDANTAITIAKTGSSFATVTHFDVNFTYVIEAA